MNYSDLNLKINTDTKCISILPGQDINILQYAPIEDKNSIIQMAIQNSEENGVYNLLKLDMYWQMYIVFTYTDIIFTDEEKADIVKIYDELVSNGIMNAILYNINQDEILYIKDKIKDTLEAKAKYRNTIASVLNSFVENLPINAEAAKNIIDKFDPEAFQNVLRFATAANGNRPI